MAHINPNFLQFFGHSRPAIAAQAQARLFLDMGQNDHVCVLPAAGRAAAKGPQATRADVHHLTQPIRCKAAAMFLDEPKPSRGLRANRCRAVPSRLLAREELGGLF